MSEKREFPWPEKFEEPFRHEQGAGWVFNACMDTTPTIGRYALAYRTAAEELFRPLGESEGAERHHNDLLVYPLVFCWRQFLELMLKEMVSMARALSGKSGSANLHKHDLMPLWNELKRHLPGLGARPAEIEIFGRTLARLAEYDPDSFAFRYPTDKQGASTQSDIPLHINLKFLNDTMQGIANWLDAGHSEMSERLRFEAEMTAEYEAEMRSTYGDEEDY
jgi:hypothetical protein